MDQTNNKPNYFVRTLIIILCLGIGAIIFYNFYKVEPKGELKNGIYFLISVLTVLVLSESFDNFSIGKILSIQREIRKKEDENKKLEERNNQLITNLISVTSVQKQESTNVFGDYYSASRKNIQLKKNNSNVQELLERIGNSSVITELEKRIIAELKEKDLEIEGDTDKVLLRHLAGTQLVLEFEKIHQIIFGSQIQFLQQINTLGAQGVPQEYLSEYYENVIHRFPDSFKNWSQDQYFSFLFSKFLLVKKAEYISLTDLGREYLLWIVRSGLSEEGKVL